MQDTDFTKWILTLFICCLCMQETLASNVTSTTKPPGSGSTNPTTSSEENDDSLKDLFTDFILPIAQFIFEVFLGFLIDKYKGGTVDSIRSKDPDKAEITSVTEDEKGIVVQVPKSNKLCSKNTLQYRPIKGNDDGEWKSIDKPIRVENNTNIFYIKQEENTQYEYRAVAFWGVPWRDKTYLPWAKDKLFNSHETKYKLHCKDSDAPNKPGILDIQPNIGGNKSMFEIKVNPDVENRGRTHFNGYNFYAQYIKTTKVAKTIQQQLSVTEITVNLNENNNGNNSGHSTDRTKSNDPGNKIFDSTDNDNAKNTEHSSGQNTTNNYRMEKQNAIDTPGNSNSRHSLKPDSTNAQIVSKINNNNGQDSAHPDGRSVNESMNGTNSSSSNGESVRKNMTNTSQEQIMVPKLKDNTNESDNHDKLKESHGNECLEELNWKISETVDANDPKLKLHLKDLSKNNYYYVRLVSVRNQVAIYSRIYCINGENGVANNPDESQVELNNDKTEDIEEDGRINTPIDEPDQETEDYGKNTVDEDKEEQKHVRSKTEGNIHEQKQPTVATLKFNFEAENANTTICWYKNGEPLKSNLLPLLYVRESSDKDYTINCKVMTDKLTSFLRFQSSDLEETTLHVSEKTLVHETDKHPKQEANISIKPTNTRDAAQRTEIKPEIKRKVPLKQINPVVSVKNEPSWLPGKLTIDNTKKIREQIKRNKRINKVEPDVYNYNTTSQELERKGFNNITPPHQRELLYHLGKPLFSNNTGTRRGFTDVMLPKGNKKPAAGTSVEFLNEIQQSKSTLF